MKKRSPRRSRTTKPLPSRLLPVAAFLLLALLVLAAALIWREVRRADTSDSRSEDNPQMAADTTNSQATPSNVTQRSGPDQAVPLVNEGNEFLAAGNIDAAIRCYEEALKITPEDEDIHYNLAIAFARKGDDDKALEQYGKTLEIWPDYAEAHNNVANLLMKKGRFDEAIHHLEEALRIVPDHAPAHNNLGTALGRQGRVNEAIIHFADAVRLNPAYTDARFNLGNAYASQRRFDEAIAEFSIVLRIQPDFEPAMRALMRARHQQAQTRK